MVDLRKRIFSIFGLNLSGKSNFAKYLASKYKTVFFDVLGEHYKDFDAYVPEQRHRPDVQDEYEKFIHKVRYMKNYNMIIVDEANRVFPNKKPFKPKARAFFDEYRHYNKGIGFIARRPSQLNTDIPELSHHIFVFNLKGKNDLQYLNSINRKIGYLPARLEPYHFIHIKPDRSFEIHRPIPNMD